MAADEQRINEGTAKYQTFDAEFWDRTRPGEHDKGLCLWAGLLLSPRTSSVKAPSFFRAPHKREHRNLEREQLLNSRAGSGELNTGSLTKGLWYKDQYGNP